MYWIFAFGEFTDFSQGTKNDLFKRVKKFGKWPIGKYTQNRRRIKKGDKVIFYQTGGQSRTGFKFVGNAVLASDLQPPENKQDFFSFVRISELNLWEKELHVSEVESPLSIQKGFQREEIPLQCCFQMAIRKITAEDYHLLIKNRKLRY